MTRPCLVCQPAAALKSCTRSTRALSKILVEAVLMIVPIFVEKLLLYKTDLTTFVRRLQIMLNFAVRNYITKSWIFLTSAHCNQQRDNCTGYLLWPLLQLKILFLQYQLTSIYMRDCRQNWGVAWWWEIMSVFVWSVASCHYPTEYDLSIWSLSQQQVVS